MHDHLQRSELFRKEQNPAPKPKSAAELRDEAFKAIPWALPPKRNAEKP